MKAIPEAHPDTEVLYSRLRECKKGDEIDYATLGSLIGRNVQGDARGLLYTARNRARARDGLVFEAIRGIGLKCLSNSETVHAASSALKHVRRYTKRASRKLITVDYDALNKEDQTEHNTHLSILGAMGLMASPRNQAKVLAAVEETHARLPMRGLLEAVTAARAHKANGKPYEEAKV